ncbi:MAG: rhomboid family intramembrane serine protease [Pseudomonadota bacterium]
MENTPPRKRTRRDNAGFNSTAAPHIDGKKMARSAALSDAEVGQTNNQQEQAIENTKQQPFFSAPSIIKWLLLGFWSIYAVLLILPRNYSELLGVHLALSPVDLFSAGNLTFQDRATGLIGHMFVHSGFQHIATNSLLFLAFGVPVVRRLSSVDRQPPPFLERFVAQQATFGVSLLFLAFFILSGIAGAFLFSILYYDERVLLVGASGGVSGLFGGIVRMINRSAGQFTPGLRPLAPLTDPIVWILSGVFIVLNIAQGLFGVGLGPGEQVDIAWEAHLGGFFFGLLSFPFFDKLAQSLNQK